MLRVAVEFDGPARGVQARRKINQRPGRQMVNRQLALLLGNYLLLLAMPGNSQSMPSHEIACLAGKQFLVRLVRATRAVPGVGLLAVAVGDLVEAEEDAPVVGVETARALG